MNSCFHVKLLILSAFWQVINLRDFKSLYLKEEYSVFLARQFESFSVHLHESVSWYYQHSQLCVLRKASSSNFDHSFYTIILPDAVSVVLWRCLLPFYITISYAGFCNPPVSSSKHLNRNWKIVLLKTQVKMQYWFSSTKLLCLKTNSSFFPPAFSVSFDWLQSLHFV